MIKALYMLLYCLLITACGSDNTQAKVVKDVEDNVTIEMEFINGLDLPNNQNLDDYKILIYGNSHTVGLPSIITSMIKIGLPHKNVEIVNAGGGFLDESIKSTSAVNILYSEKWSHVILQGQKYSQSGSNNYSTDAAVSWIQYAKGISATPILYPEHPQKGNINEGQEVYDLHLSIAAKESSCVAPIGPVWDEVISRELGLNLYSDDGNHANENGRFLTALVFYEIITAQPADLLPYIANINIDETTQDILGQITSEVLIQISTCQFPD